MKSNRIKLKSLLSESYSWERKPGEKLPTIDDVSKKYQEKTKSSNLNELSNTNDFIFTEKGSRFFDAMKQFTQAPDFDSSIPFNAEYLADFFENPREFIEMLQKYGFVTSYS